MEANLNAASGPDGMNTRSMKFHKLTGNLKDFYAVTVSVIFKFDDTNAIDVNCIDMQTNF
ncbi:MAG: hypothetical protein A3F12_01955 [Gammaproteobacteria bacterium RIFCSPHIGHO2_12_FULL_38_14]|nr:MAG: hypothetical protein A3F12_01955 [Gammaproteobacteria bacterium RIFCSPHIGHO2_12_FULL_38_14]